MCASVQSRLDRWGLSTRSFVQKSWTGLRVGQPFPGCILVGAHRRANERPFNADLRVIPQNTALVFGKPIIVRFVEKCSALRTHHEDVRKPRRNPQLTAIFSG